MMRQRLGLGRDVLFERLVCNGPVVMPVAVRIARNRLANRMTSGGAADCGIVGSS